jgi:hypothetical protein
VSVSSETPPSEILQIDAMSVELLTGTSPNPNSPEYPAIDISLLPGVPNQRGPQGPQGPAGPAGPQGPQGLPSPQDVAIGVLYVSKSGSDLNDGSSINKAFATIKAACAAVTFDFTTIFVKSGTYIEQNPVTIPAKTSIVGDSLRSVNVQPANPTQDIFYVNNGSYVKEVTFRGHLSPAAAIAFPPTGAGVITASPYIYNCSSITTTGTGMRIDGSLAGGGKSMVAGQFTQVNQGGVGIRIINQGYAQLVSIYTIACNYGIWCESGGFCSLIGSDTSFGNFGLVADGLSPVLYSGSSSSLAKRATTILLSNLTARPRINNVLKFTGDSAGAYYTVANVTNYSAGAGTCTVTLLEPLANDIAGNTVSFYQRSLITASGHTFEYAGAGTELATALPQLGGIPDQTKEVKELNGGKVFYTSTDQRGDFRIGSGLTINRASGTIEGDAFNKSLFAVMTPYLLAIEG